ncbi:MAG: hypothetical protein ACREGR_02175 [Minisyncoccia bacterium]
MAKRKIVNQHGEVTDAELHKDIDAYHQAGGNRSEAGRLRKLKRTTYNDRLVMACKRFGITLGKVVDGQIDYVKAAQKKLPPKGGVKRYILTSAQNNTHPHEEGLRNILAYTAWLDCFAKSSCEFMVGTFSYQIDAYGAKAVKRGAYDPKRSRENLWYSPELMPYICDDSVQLAPGLVWCGEMNILPTAVNPLLRLDDYNGRNSNVVPHAKFAMDSIASLPDEATKFNYTTGVITLRNYIKKRAGIIAERAHCYGAILVEVDDAGNWFVRQLQVGDKGEVYDIGPAGYRGVKIAGGQVEAIPVTVKNGSVLEAIVWGDIHTAEMELWVRELGWGDGGMVDQLQPRKQFLHDIFSMRARGHHEIKNFHKTYQKMVDGEGLVQDEIQITADFLREVDRPWMESVVVRSNHDRHLDRWLNEANPNLDPPNARYFMELQGALLKSMDEGNRDFSVLEYALRQAEGGIPADILFLAEDQSYVICKSASGGIECGLHGDLGPNGAKGTTRSFRKLGRPANKAHDHTAAINWPVFSGGACSLDFPYMKGPNAHSVSHIANFVNGARQILTFWNGKFRA